MATPSPTDPVTVSSEINRRNQAPNLIVTNMHRHHYSHCLWVLMLMPNLAHLKVGALGFMVKLSTIQAPAPTA